MALIYIYDATELDKKQISDAFDGTDHRIEYIADKISPANCDPQAEVVSVFISSSVTREIIEALPRLRLIACRSTGFNNIDFDAVREHDITVVNVPTYGEATVAEYAFTLLLALTRKLPAVLETEEKQFAPGDLRGTDLQGKVFGVIGTGHIGQKALKIAAGFSMETIGYDAFPRPELQDEYHFKYVGLDELLERSDVVSLHTPYLPSTHHLMNAERLGKMKRGAILVNTARGELTDTGALIEFLDNGHLGGAAIDVVEGEALLNHQEETALLRGDTIPDSLLRHSVEISVLKKMPNVVVSPHNAFNTVEAILRINQTTAKNIIDYWYGNVPNKVQPPKKPMGKLLIVRHTESEWNALGKWTGLTDVHLSDKGFKDAALLGMTFRGLNLNPDIAYCSEQLRTRETLQTLLAAAQLTDVPVVANKAINERDYGDYTGKNKWEIQQQVGNDNFTAIRRGWDVPIPGGETLKMVYERAVPFYTDTVLPELRSGKNVLLVGHGNSLRALIKYLESLSEEAIGQREMPFGQIITYDIAPDSGLSAGSSSVGIDTAPSHA